MNHWLVLLLLVLLGCASRGVGDTLFVCSDGCEFTSIQSAIDSASSGDVIQLAAETYQMDSADFGGKSLTLRGVVDVKGEPASRLEGVGVFVSVSGAGGASAVAVLENLELAANSTVYAVAPKSGMGVLEIRNCAFLKTATDSISKFVWSQSSSSGGGRWRRIVVDACRFEGRCQAVGLNNSDNDIDSVTISGCRFVDSYALAGGGAILAESGPIGGHVEIRGCEFLGCESSSQGGAVCLGWDSVIMVDCIFTGNSAERGGGIWFGVDYALVSGCVFSQNEAQRGGGLFLGSGSLALSNCSASENSSSIFGGFAFVDRGSLKIVDCVVSENSSGGFAGGIYSEETVAIAQSVVCGNSLPQLYGWSNLGGVRLCDACESCADGHSSQSPCSTGVRGDFNCDGVFDSNDYLAIQAELGLCGPDLDGDGMVSASDIGLLLGAWGLCP